MAAGAEESPDFGEAADVTAGFGEVGDVTAAAGQQPQRSPHARAGAAASRASRARFWELALSFPFVRAATRAGSGLHWSCWSRTAMASATRAPKTSLETSISSTSSFGISRSMPVTLPLLSGQFWSSSATSAKSSSP